MSQNANFPALPPEQLAKLLANSSMMDALYDRAKTMMWSMVQYKELQMLYSCALKEIQTKFEILDTEFKLEYNRDPIASISTRLKRTESVMDKLERKGLPFSLTAIEEHIHDMAGIRVICSYIDDIYLIADALLRAALGTGDFLTEKDDGGKPYVKGRENFHYNLSHSGRYVVIAWGDVPVGVDVQKHENTLDRRAVAEQSFAPDERIYAGESAERFFEVWTGKESYLKYTGEGLRRDMRSFSMFRTEPPVRLLSCLPHGGYSLCLCAADREYTFELSDVRQL